MQMDEHVRQEIARASAAFMAAMKEAQAMSAAGSFGPRLNEVLAHAQELLDIIDDHMRSLDQAEHVAAFALAAKMRSSLEALARAVTDVERGDAGTQ
jgi:hypothetical protein